MSRQFDVHHVAFGDDIDSPFLVNLQSDHLDHLRTIVVAPLWPAADVRPASPVHVAIRLDGRPYSLAVNEIAFVRAASLGNIAVERDRIVRALDVLFTGI